MSIRGEVFVIHGDITQITADAIAYPTTISTGRDIRGHATPAFDKHYPGVTAQWEALRTRNASETKRPTRGTRFHHPPACLSRLASRNPLGLVPAAPLC